MLVQWWLRSFCISLVGIKRKICTSKLQSVGDDRLRVTEKLNAELLQNAAGHFNRIGYNAIGHLYKWRVRGKYSQLCRYYLLLISQPSSILVTSLVISTHKSVLGIGWHCSVELGLHSALCKSLLQSQYQQPGLKSHSDITANFSMHHHSVIYQIVTFVVIYVSAMIVRQRWEHHTCRRLLEAS